MNSFLNISQTAIKGILHGNKIDIPDVWKSSSGQNQQTFNICLHCLYPSIDEEYHKQIVLPLLILYRLALPKATSSDDQQDEEYGNPQVKENDILTYENPAYIEASVDGMWQTKLGAITNMQVTMDFKHQSFANDRPYMVNVTLTITDLYNVIVWNDERDTYAPNGQDIARNLEEHEKDPAAPLLHEYLNFEFVPQHEPEDKDKDSQLGKSTYQSTNKDFISQIAQTVAESASQIGPKIEQNVPVTAGIAETINAATQSVQNVLTELSEVAQITNLGNGSFLTTRAGAYFSTLLNSVQRAIVDAVSGPKEMLKKAISFVENFERVVDNNNTD